MSSFLSRKAQRTAYYEKFVKGWKLETCAACAGSGVYDSTNSPPCSGCEGSGKCRVPPKNLTPPLASR